MARVDWPLWKGRPCIEISLALAPGGQPHLRKLLADTGAASNKVPFELILDEDDCLLCGGMPGATITLGGAIVGSFPLYDVDVSQPGLGFGANLRVVGVPSVPGGFDGIACFKFLNRFHYGNFGDPVMFGLES